MSPILLSESQVPTSTMRLQCDANWATACSDRQERQRRFIASIYPTLSCNYQNGHSQKQLCTSKTNTDHLNILILTWDSPPKQLPIMALDANSPWSYHVQVTASNANLTLPIPLQSPAQLQNCLPTISSWNGVNGPTHATNQSLPSSSRSDMAILEVMAAPQPPSDNTR